MQSLPYCKYRNATLAQKAQLSDTLDILIQWTVQGPFVQTCQGTMALPALRDISINIHMRTDPRPQVQRTLQGSCSQEGRLVIQPQLQPPLQEDRPPWAIMSRPPPVPPVIMPITIQAPPMAGTLLDRDRALKHP